LSLRNHTSREVIKVLTKHYGFAIERQSGSHFQLKHSDGRRLTVPRRESTPIKESLMLAILAQVGTTKEDFLKYL
jgi:predicted RNA binding protein YcfA (HicA-like mRNA interferase family)